jgi:hypothetical protein
MSQAGKKWAIVTLHSWLPSKVEQIARVRAWGLEEDLIEGMDLSGVLVDDVRKVKRTTNWHPHLKERFGFIANARLLTLPEAPVFFATPLCVGFSEKLAKDTIEGLWEAGMHVYVHSIGAIYSQGDDLTDFLAGVGRDANAAHVRASRNRKSKEKHSINLKKVFEKKPCLYRHFDENGNLLYIGACANYATRRHSHKALSEWAPEIYREEIVYFETLRDALDAERTAIWNEKPVHNQRRWRPKGLKAKDIQITLRRLPRPQVEEIARDLGIVTDASMSKANIVDFIERETGASADANWISGRPVPWDEAL